MGKIKTKKIIIVGAGNLGKTTALELIKNNALDEHSIKFVDPGVGSKVIGIERRRLPVAPEGLSGQDYADADWVFLCIPGNMVMRWLDTVWDNVLTREDVRARCVIRSSIPLTWLERRMHPEGYRFLPVETERGGWYDQFRRCLYLPEFSTENEMHKYKNSNAEFYWKHPDLDESVSTAFEELLGFNEEVYNLESLIMHKHWSNAAKAVVFAFQNEYAQAHRRFGINPLYSSLISHEKDMAPDLSSIVYAGKCLPESIEQASKQTEFSLLDYVNKQRDEKISRYTSILLSFAVQAGAPIAITGLNYKSSDPTSSYQHSAAAQLFLSHLKTVKDVSNFVLVPSKFEPPTRINEVLQTHDWLAPAFRLPYQNVCGVMALNRINNSARDNFTTIARKHIALAYASGRKWFVIFDVLGQISRRQIEATQKKYKTVQLYVVQTLDPRMFIALRDVLTNNQEVGGNERRTPVYLRT